MERREGPPARGIPDLRDNRMIAKACSRYRDDASAIGRPGEMINSTARRAAIRGEILARRRFPDLDGRVGCAACCLFLRGGSQQIAIRRPIESLYPVGFGIEGQELLPCRRAPDLHPPAGPHCDVLPIRRSRDGIGVAEGRERFSGGGVPHIDGCAGARNA